YRSAAEPVDGEARPAITRSRVLLPLPETPTRETNSPAPIDRLTRSRIDVEPRRRPTPERERSSAGAAATFKGSIQDWQGGTSVRLVWAWRSCLATLPGQASSTWVFPEPGVGRCRR